jgi:hypothetical protein
MNANGAMVALIFILVTTMTCQFIAAGTLFLVKEPGMKLVGMLGEPFSAVEREASVPAALSGLVFQSHINKFVRVVTFYMLEMIFSNI